MWTFLTSVDFNFVLLDLQIFYSFSGSILNGPLSRSAIDFELCSASNVKF